MNGRGRSEEIANKICPFVETNLICTGKRAKPFPVIACHWEKRHGEEMDIISITFECLKFIGELLENRKGLNWLDAINKTKI